MAQDEISDVLDLQTTRATDTFQADTPRRLLVPGLVILGHPDPGRVGEQVALPGLVSGKSIGLSRLEPTFSKPSGASRSLPLNDPYLSRQPVQLRAEAMGAVRLERQDSRTHVRVGGEELAAEKVLTAEEVEEGVILTLGRRVVLFLHLIDPLPADGPRYGLVGESLSIHRLRQEIHTAAALDTSVLLRGETGTGKELVARALHENGPRRDGPFLAVNMAALPPTLAAAELFGAARGAYTGADRKKEGFFQRADGGTLFLDEIGETPIAVQALLLRALETREIQPVGSAAPRAVDVQILAATDADLEGAIADGAFRAPLLHRLAGYEILLPTLRERRDDIARLLFHFLELELVSLGRRDLLQQRSAPCLPSTLVVRLVGYRWPGNVRQLRNVARRLALALREGRKEEALHGFLDPLLSEEKRAASAKSEGSHEATRNKVRRDVALPDGYRSVRAYRRAQEIGEDELVAALRGHDWNLRTAAAALGVSRPTLYRMIEACERIRKASDLSRKEVEAAFLAADRDAKKAARKLEVSPQGFKRRLTELGLR